MKFAYINNSLYLCIVKLKQELQTEINMDAKSKKEFIQRVFNYMDDFEKAYLWNIYQDAIGGTIYIDELTDDFIDSQLQGMTPYQLLMLFNNSEIDLEDDFFTLTKTKDRITTYAELSDTLYEEGKLVEWVVGNTNEAFKYVDEQTIERAVADIYNDKFADVDDAFCQSTLWLYLREHKGIDIKSCDWFELINNIYKSRNK